MPGPLARYAAGWYIHREVLAATVAGDRRDGQDWPAEFTVARAMLRGPQ